MLICWPSSNVLLFPPYDSGCQPLIWTSILRGGYYAEFVEIEPTESTEFRDILTRFYPLNGSMIYKYASDVLCK